MYSLSIVRNSVVENIPKKKIIKIIDMHPPVTDS
jgi:hypothetical protein